MSKIFIPVTLASNNQDAVIASDNVAFAVRIHISDDKGEEDFTRVYFKQIIMESEESKWIDIKETPQYIYKAK